MASGPVRVRGLKELTRDLNKMSKDLSKEVRTELREAGHLVRDDARVRMPHARTASGYRTRVYRAGLVAVEQGRRKSPNLAARRPNWGTLQMRRALVPALDAKQGEVVDKLDKMLGRLAGENGW